MAYSERYYTAAGEQLDELDFVLAVANTDRVRFYVVCVFITTDNTFSAGICDRCARLASFGAKHR